MQGPARWIVPLTLGLTSCLFDPDDLDTDKEYLCCVEIDPDIGVEAYNCESSSAVADCMMYNFSDCYRESSRNGECR